VLTLLCMAVLYLLLGLFCLAGLTCKKVIYNRNISAKIKVELKCASLCYVRYPGLTIDCG